MKNEIVEGWHRIKATFWKNYIVGVKGSKKMVFLLKVVCILEVLAFIADICPADYWFDWFEKMVTYNISDVVPVVAILWGAVTIPMGYLLGQIERRNYGIRLVDFIIASVGMKDSVFMIGSLWGQLVFIVPSVLYKMPILLMTVSWGQLLYVFSSFYLVMLSISYEAIHNVISEQSKVVCEGTKDKSDRLAEELKNEGMKKRNEKLTNYTNIVGVRHWLLIDMVKNLNYCRLDDMESLERVLTDNVGVGLKGIVGRKIAYNLFEIIMSVADREAVMRISENVFSANVSMDMRKGILAVLISERDSEYYSHCSNLMQELESCNINNEDIAQISIWGILWSMHQRNLIMSSVEQLRNDAFIDTMQQSLQMKGIRFIGDDEENFNELVIESCMDFMMLMQVDVADKIVAQLFENKIEF